MDCTTVHPTGFPASKLGQEVIGSLIEQVKKLSGYSKMGIGIGVGNDAAIKFWNACGFTDVIQTKKYGTHADEWRVKKL